VACVKTVMMTRLIATGKYKFLDLFGSRVIILPAKQSGLEYERLYQMRVEWARDRKFSNQAKTLPRVEPWRTKTSLENGREMPR
jgi:hypothetical protein